MSYPAVFCVKLQLHFGGDVHEITVPAYGGAEPTVTDLMNAVERDFRVPRALQNLVFHGQELHVRPNEPLSRFGIKNGGAVRLVGRMAPTDLINQINAQNNSYSYPQSYYIQQPYTIPTYQTNEQSIPYYSEQFQYAPNPSVSTQYDPPPPPTPPNKIQPPPTPQNNTQPPPPTPNQGQTSERSNGQEQKPPATPNSSNTK